MPKAMWGGRFKKGIDQTLKDFSYSLLVDYELFDAEITVNEAYVKMLVRVGLLKASESKKILVGLKQVSKAFKPGDACLHWADFEDVHTYIQAQLEKRVGSVAKKLHTGRSRNDLVVTSTRVFLKGKVREVQQKYVALQSVLVQCANKSTDVYLPGFTHLKKAQPIVLAHHFLAYVEMIGDDLNRLSEAYARLDVMPLGSAALAGSALPLDRNYLAKQLGFSRISTNSLVAVSDRAFLVDILSALATLWMHLSRISEDLILWNSEAFNFVELDDSFATGSSLMPHKKNPDVFELVRGKSAAIFGELMALLTLQKGLPLSYNRDLQQDKPGVFRALRETILALDVLAPTFKTIKFNKKAMLEALGDEGLYATDILEYLVQKKIAFSDAHRIVGQVVRYAKDQDVLMKDLPINQWKKFSPSFAQDVYQLFNADASVRAKKTSGSSNPSRVRSEVTKWQKKLVLNAKKLKQKK